jgi:two-component system, NtrC family, sensor histidine kinase HydH
MPRDDYAQLAEVAGGFIHEIKNRLGTLGLNLQLLVEDFQDPQTQRDRRAHARLEKLEAECQRLTNLSNDFLRFARLRDLPLEACALAKVIEDIVDFFEPTARAAGIDIRTYLPADLPPVRLNRDMFQQALLNLMLNAEQALKGGGSITIQAAAEAQSVCLSLIDTGQGMPPDVLGKVFEPFFSTKKTGSGLGLPTTRRIVEAHGGSIDVQSEVGMGTKFTIRLPVHGA